MLQKYIHLIFLILLSISAAAQDSIRHRIILIGDAGEINYEQDKLIPNASTKILAGKTTVMYLGDNIYPTGMALPGSEDEERTKKILRSQFVPMRSKGAPVYFIPGNHDWDRMGKDGLKKIIAEGNFLAAQNDALLKLVPANGCPGPVEINISDSLVIIAFDSEWWLFPYSKTNAAADCDCNTKKEITDKLQELVYKNRYKVILLASHHPFQSYGHHGGYYSLKDHIFPLTSANKNLYIPLPVIGSLYPLLRSTFVHPEEKPHPLYQQMIKQVDAAFEGFPNMVHVAGHEHGLQLIKTNQLQVVSGSGARNAFVKKGKDALFAETKSGYVTADLLANNDVKFTYYHLKDSSFSEAFSYTKLYTSIKKQEDALFAATTANDSVVVQANAGFDSVSNFHRKLFGENYRKEWATPTKLPVIKLSTFKGGLTPLQRGGGYQSISLRLKDNTGKEWVLRSVNKYPEVLLPEPLRETFAKDIFTDAMSAQHPYSALVVPVIANAAGVPHATPIIGLVAPDKALGIYNKDFMNTVCLLEEREPFGKTDNSEKMYSELTKDNDNSFDSTLFLKARLLDLFLGDWDRHEDQWRWAVQKNSKDKKYLAVPRDRDQVFHIMDGIVPSMATKPWIAPLLHNFDGTIKQMNAFYLKSNALNRRFLNQFGYDQWMKVTNGFVAAMTDSVLEKALRQLPAESYALRHEKLLYQWKERRSNMATAMAYYYHFLNKTVDIQTTNKNELVAITDAANNGMQVSIRKINKDGEVKALLFNRIFYPNETKEIRLFTDKGNDSIIFNTSSPIKLRVVGAEGSKAYHVIQSNKKIQLYAREENVSLTGNVAKLNKHLSNDSANTAYQPTDPINKIIPVLQLGFNIDDGLMLGAAVKFVNQGFRKKPYASMQQFSFTRSFSTDAFRFKFNSEWLESIGKADITVAAKALAPDNTQNFFGVGNETMFDKTGNNIKYYRARFAIYQVDPALRWRSSNTSFISVGPSLQYYRFDAEDNTGRFITNTSLIRSYDSATIANDKAFAGIVFNLVKDSRNHPLLPTNGGYFNLKVQAYTGLNSYSKSFLQIIPELSFYKKLNHSGGIVLANRTGGGITAGKTAFYQSLFLGGHENLLGYRQYRFAGRNMLYNNLELRIKLAQVGSYILPGQLGLIGFYDAGKVWADGYNSSTIHQGVGGGFYFAPTQMAVIQLIAGHSTEGWYPNFTLGLRF